MLNGITTSSNSDELITVGYKEVSGRRQAWLVLLQSDGQPIYKLIFESENKEELHKVAEMENNNYKYQ